MRCQVAIDGRTSCVHELRQREVEDTPRPEGTRDHCGRAVRDRVLDAGLLHRPVERLDRLTRHGLVERSGQIDGVEREDEAEIRIRGEVGDGGTGERRDPGLVAQALGLPRPVRGHGGETGGHEDGGREDRDQRTETTDGPALEGVLALPRARSSSSSRSRSRALAARYSCSSRERASSVDASNARSSSRRRPRSSRLGSRPELSQSVAAPGQPTMVAKVVLRILDPDPQSIP